MISYKNNPVILFDGICNLCNGFVQFVIKRDKKKNFLFGALQGEGARQLLSSFDFPDENLTTIVLVEDSNIYTQSDAVLKIFKRLGGFWKFFSIFIFIPRPIRDWIYRLIAKYRYSIFGKRKECMIPTPELKSRFLDQG